MRKIDRYDTRGDICEHWTRDGRRTICGLSIGVMQSQPPCGNRPCKRCEKIAARAVPPASSDSLAAMTYEQWLDYYRGQPGGWLVIDAPTSELRNAYEQRLSVLTEDEKESVS